MSAIFTAEKSNHTITQDMGLDLRKLTRAFVLIASDPENIIAYKLTLTHNLFVNNSLENMNKLLNDSICSSINYFETVQNLPTPTCILNGKHLFTTPDQSTDLPVKDMNVRFVPVKKKVPECFLTKFGVCIPMSKLLETSILMDKVNYKIDLYLQASAELKNYILSLNYVQSGKQFSPEDFEQLFLTFDSKIETLKLKFTHSIHSCDPKISKFQDNVDSVCKIHTDFSDMIVKLKHMVETAQMEQTASIYSRSAKEPSPLWYEALSAIFTAEKSNHTITQGMGLDLRKLTRAFVLIASDPENIIAYKLTLTHNLVINNSLENMDKLLIDSVNSLTAYFEQAKIMSMPKCI